MNADSIQTVAVLGLGTMGHSIAQTFAAAGCRVQCFDNDTAALDSLLTRIRSNLQQMAESGNIGQNSIDDVLSRVVVCESEEEALTQTEFVTEVVREDLAIKQELFARIESSVSPDTILASNTSTFPMTDIAAKMRRPERAVDTHWFNPPHIVPVVEVVPGEKTAEETVTTTIALLERIGKQPIRLNMELPGFLVNRVQTAMVREVWDLLDRGIASPEDIDRALRGSLGFRLAAVGPLEICDFGGLDLWARVFQNLAPEIRSNTNLPEPIRNLIDEGHHGAKTGRGIFQYTAASIDAKRDKRDRQFLALARLLNNSDEESHP